MADKPFIKSTAFFPGNEGSGLEDFQKNYCNYFIKIKQYSRLTASLNVHVATSIALYEFANWANFTETEILGEK